MHKVVFVQGGGVGHDQEAAVRHILQAVGAAVEFELIPAGRAAVEFGRDPLGPELFDAIRKSEHTRSRKRGIIGNAEWEPPPRVLLLNKVDLLKDNR